MSGFLANRAHDYTQTSQPAYAHLIANDRSTAVVVRYSIEHMRSSHDEHHLRYIAVNADKFHETDVKEHEAVDGAGVDAFQLNFNPNYYDATRGWTLGSARGDTKSLTGTDLVLINPPRNMDLDIAPVHAVFDMHSVSALITLKKAGHDKLIIVWENSTAVEIRHNMTYTFVNRRTEIQIGNLNFVLIYHVPWHDRDLQRLVKTRDSLLDTLHPTIRGSVLPKTRGLFPPKDGYPISGSTFICRTLAVGGYGTVSVAIDRNRANVVAVKRQTLHSPKALRNALQEYDQSLHFQGVDNLLACTEKWLESGCHAPQNDMKFPADISFSMPLMLADLEHSKLIGLPRSDIAGIFWQVMNGIREMHDRGMMHRDVTLANMVFASAEPFRVKLIDYGKTKKAIFASSYPCGPFPYNAPEIAKLAKRETTIPYTNAIDIWSWGYAVLRALGFQWTSQDRYIDDYEWQRINSFLDYQEKVIPETISLSSLLRRVFIHNPNFRPTARQVLCDPWFQQYGLGL